MKNRLRTIIFSITGELRLTRAMNFPILPLSFVPIAVWVPTDSTTADLIALPLTVILAAVYIEINAFSMSLSSNPIAVIIMRGIGIISQATFT